MTRSARYGFGLTSGENKKGKAESGGDCSLSLSSPDVSIASMFLFDDHHQPPLFASRHLSGVDRSRPIHALLRAATDLICVLAQLQGDCEASDPLARGGS